MGILFTILIPEMLQKTQTGPLIAWLLDTVSNSALEWKLCICSLIPSFAFIYSNCNVNQLLKWMWPLLKMHRSEYWCTVLCLWIYISSAEYLRWMESGTDSFFKVGSFIQNMFYACMLSLWMVQGLCQLFHSFKDVGRMKVIICFRVTPQLCLLLGPHRHSWNQKLALTLSMSASRLADAFA